MTEEKTCYNCGNKNCHIFYSAVKQDVAEHHEAYEYNDFDCVNHDKWKEMKAEEIRTDNTKTLKNALERIAELEEKISVLLSCKDCPENKDGLICQKEYENKCLAQKIQFIKELQQENAELKERLNAINQLIPELEKENAELKGQVEMGYEVYNNNLDYSQHIEEQLTKAKEIIEELYNIIPASMSDYAKEPMEHARKFMTEE